MIFERDDNKTITNIHIRIILCELNYKQSIDSEPQLTGDGHVFHIMS